mmetsp:Transcript_102954/g.295214  ORF Transcript_102954/g.295214 Transcript_102954/m.295214 type:complete len:194 (+) Transcript_102954:589-1170(+)
MVDDVGDDISGQMQKSLFLAVGGILMMAFASFMKFRSMQANVVKFDAIMTDIVGPHLDSLTQKYSDVSIYWSLDVEKVTVLSSRRSFDDRPRRGHRHLSAHRVNGFSIMISVSHPVVSASAVPVFSPVVTAAAAAPAPAPASAPPAPPPASLSGGSDSWVTELERLASLKDRGVLTDKEFNEMKARLLAKNAV